MVVMVEPTPLKKFREELGIVQDDMALKSGIRANTYARVERGKNVSYTTALSILKALNSFRAEKGFPPIERVEDLGLSLV
jgi:DNA-binding XRE family transcriptional regulator